MSKRIDFEAIRRQHPIRDFLQSRGYKFDASGKCRCPLHSERTPSFHVWIPAGENTQRWHCHGACNKGGDIIDLVIEMGGYDPKTGHAQALKDLGVTGDFDTAAEPPPPAPPPFEMPPFVVCTDPARVPRAGAHIPVRNKCGEHKKLPPADAIYVYKNADNGIIGCVYRRDFIKLDGNKKQIIDSRTGKPIRAKIVMPLRYDGKEWWTVGFGKDVPIYGEERAAERPGAPVLFVEGEKCVDVIAHAPLWSDYVVLSWQGGSGQASNVDVARILKGRPKALFWPDNASNGVECMMRVAAQAQSAQVPQVLMVRPPMEELVPELGVEAAWGRGWDVFDAIKAWGPEKARRWMLDRLEPVARPKTETPARQMTRAELDVHAFTNLADWIYKIEPKVRAQRDGTYVLDGLPLVINSPTLFVAQRLGMDPREAAFELAGLLEVSLAPDPEERKIVSMNRDPLTEDAIALRFAHYHGAGHRYCQTEGKWFQWHSTHWKKDTTGHVYDLVRDAVRDASEDVEKDSTRRAMRKHTFVSGAEKMARADRRVAVTASFFDRDDWLLGTPGGTVDLRTGLVRKADPVHGISRLTSCGPATSADCPRFLTFLDEATGHDPDMVRFLQQYAGYSLTGSVQEHALAFLWGPGGNGKSVLLNILTSILKDYAQIAPMDSLMASYGDKHSTDLAGLKGARMVTASETEEGRSWAEARIKAITGGEPISARFMKQDFFTYTPTFKLFVIGNHQPVLKNVDDAMRRRFNMVPFTVKPQKKVPGLDKIILDSEGPQVLRWLIDGCLDWQKNGLVRPERVLMATAEYFEDQDLMAQWIEENCITAPGISDTMSSLYADWATYVLAAGQKVQSKKAFGTMLGQRGFERFTGTGNIKFRKGIQLRPHGSTTSWDR